MAKCANSLADVSRERVTVKDRDMPQSQKYQVVGALRTVCAQFSIDAQRVTRRAGLPHDFLAAGARPVTATEYYALWQALDDEAQDPKLPLRLAEAVLEQGFDSAIYAFFSSPTVRIGLERKALLKPLIAPIRMALSMGRTSAVLTFGSTVPGRDLPALIGWFDLAFFVLSIRRGTGEHVIPLSVRGPMVARGWAGASGFFGCAFVRSDDYQLILARADADRPLISRNDALWSQIESGLKDRFRREMPARTLSARVRQALVDGLPGGQVTADQIARALAVSKRSLQRRLNEEGASFKDILEDTRRAMAINYLQNSDLSLQEIALLLGFRDPSSFFRAFRGWTGHTPQAVRAARA